MAYLYIVHKGVVAHTNGRSIHILGIPDGQRKFFPNLNQELMSSVVCNTSTFVDLMQSAHCLGVAEGR